MAKRKQQITVAQQQDLFNFDVNKFENFNATVNELRTGIYAPIEKISTNSITFKKFVQNKKRRSILSSWGEVHVIVEDNRIQRNVRTQELVDLLIYIEDDRDSDNQGNRKDIST